MYQPTIDAVRIATFISFTLPRWRDVFMRGGMYIPPQCLAFLWDAHTGPIAQSSHTHTCVPVVQTKKKGKEKKGSDSNAADEARKNSIRDAFPHCFRLTG